MLRRDEGINPTTYELDTLVVFMSRLKINLFVLHGMSWFGLAWYGMVLENPWDFCFYV